MTDHPAATPPATVSLRGAVAEVAGAWAAVRGAVVGAVPPALADVAAGAVNGVLRPGAGDEAMPPVGQPSAPGGGPPGDGPAHAPAVSAFAAQFVVDVASMDDEIRRPAMQALGDHAFAFTQVLYVLDMGLRMRAALRQLGLAVPTSTEGDAATAVRMPGRANGATAPSGGRRGGTPADSWSALESWMGSVARLEALGPVTTELVRLRGAAAHDCRLCRSRRDVRASEVTGRALLDTVADARGVEGAAGGAGAGGRALLGTVAVPDLLAMGVVDAMVWSPSAWPDGLAAAVRDAWGDEAAAEIVLDVARNAANKMAVALGADAPHVRADAGEVEWFEVGAAGEVVVRPAPPT